MNWISVIGEILLVELRFRAQVRLGSALVVVPEGALERETKIKITRLRKVARTDILYNATRGGGGYRLEPAGLRLKGGAILSLPYDERVYEMEGGAEGLRSYYYDKRQKWTLPH